MDFVDIQAVESKLTDVTVTPIPMGTKLSGTGGGIVGNQQQQHLYGGSNQTVTAATSSTIAAIGAAAAGSNLVTPVTTLNQFPNNSGLSKYAQLLMVIEEMGRDLRPTYSGSRSSAERLKRGIVHARILVRECLLETERSARP